jgi:hypothetical protein
MQTLQPAGMPPANEPTSRYLRSLANPPSPRLDAHAGMGIAQRRDMTGVDLR